MLGFLGETVRPSRADIVEWQPMSELPWVALGFWAIPAALAIVAILRRGRSIPLAWLVITIVLGIGDRLKNATATAHETGLPR